MNDRPLTLPPIAQFATCRITSTVFQAAHLGRLWQITTFVLLLSCSLTSSGSWAGRAQAQQGGLLPFDLRDDDVNVSARASTASVGVSDRREMTPRELYDFAIHGTVWIMTVSGETVGYGTGFVIDKERRLVMTNQHVIGDAEGVFVYFPAWTDGELETSAEYYRSQQKPPAATIIDSDHKLDLAILQVDSIPANAIELEFAPESARPADRVHTIGGDPLFGDVAFVYCNGSARGVAVGRIASGFVCRKLESDMDTNPGNSGGPVLNDYGQVVAVHEGSKDDADGVKLHVDVLAVQSYLGEILPLLPADNAEKLHRFGMRHFDEGRFEIAKRCLTHAIKMDRKNSRLYIDRGWSEFRLENLNQAILDFDRALAIDANQALAHAGRGMVRHRQGQFQDAITDFSQALRLNEQDAQVYYYRAKSYYSLDDFESALRDLNRAIEIDDQDANFYQRRGDTLQELGRHEDALVDLKKVLELNPNNDGAVYLIGYSHFELRQFAKAIEIFKIAHKMNPERAAYLTWLGDAARVEGELDLAFEAYSESIDRDDRDAFAYWGRGLVLQAADRIDRAQEDFARAESLQPGITSKTPRGGTGSAQVSNRQLEQSTHRPSLVGVWVCEFNLNGYDAIWAVEFKADGTFRSIIKIDQGAGVVTTSDTKGSFTYRGTTLSTWPEVGEADSGRCVVDGNRANIYITDLGRTLTFVRVEE